MVFSFLIVPSAPKRRNVIHSSLFGFIPEHNDSNGGESNAYDVKPCAVQQDNAPIVRADNNMEYIRMRRKDVVTSIIERVKKEFELNVQLGATTVLGELQIQVDPYCNPDLEAGGVFTLPLLDSSGDHKIVIWHAIQNGCCFILVCDWQENRVLAYRVLKKIIMSLLERCDSVQPVELMRKLYLVSAVVDVFMPNGQLTFCHQQLDNQMRRQLEAVLKGSSSFK